jgi:hypothetical protein
MASLLVTARRTRQADIGELSPRVEIWALNGLISRISATSTAETVRQTDSRDAVAPSYARLGEYCTGLQQIPQEKFRIMKGLATVSNR